jgi:hypothetical protein
MLRMAPYAALCLLLGSCSWETLDEPAGPSSSEDGRTPGRGIGPGDPPWQPLVEGAAWSDPTPSFAGSDACAECHPEIHAGFVRSGHPQMLHATGGHSPLEPWSDVGDFSAYSDTPPPGHDWTDIAFVLGGWAHKQRFIDPDGYLFTGQAVQYNVETGAWVQYFPGTPMGTKEYGCGACHNTGWQDGPHYQDRPGFGGDLVATGVQCEQCHGWGSHHVRDPENVRLDVDDSAAACGTCHYRIDTDHIFAEDGFRDDHQQYNELLAGGHRDLRCVDCHDPHRSALYSDAVHNPGKGMVRSCAECHPDEDENQASSLMETWLSCTSCHMPWASKSAVAAPLAYTADQRSHTVAIDTDASAPATYEALGFEMMYPYLTLDHACRHCHRAGGSAYPLSDAALELMAVGYHDP